MATGKVKKEMKMKRIPFGTETELSRLLEHCPGCGVSRRQEHEYGCPLECCPSCHGCLLHCDCLVLPLVDEMKITAAIARSMSLGKVTQLLKSSPLLERGLLENGAMKWIMDHQPVELMQEWDRIAEQAIVEIKRDGLEIYPSQEL